MSEGAFVLVYIVLIYGFIIWWVSPGGGEGGYIHPKRRDETWMQWRERHWVAYMNELRRIWRELTGPMPKD